MRRYLLFIMMALSLFSTKIYATDCLKKDVLSQLYNLNDPSILEMKENKYYLNVDRIIIAQEGIYLSSDYFGLIALSNLMRDPVGTYTIDIYGYYMCTECQTFYRSEPDECDVCGNTDFIFVDQLGED